MLFLPLALAALASSNPASPGPAKAGGSPSPKWEALRNGAFDAASRLPGKDAQEELYLTGVSHLARYETDAAEAAWKKMKPGTRLQAELAWQLAHARKDPQRIAASAKALCTLGDPTGRACVDEEFYGGRVVRGSATLHGPTEVKLAPGMPFPLTLARIGQVQTGVIFDTGASQTVISKALAEHLGLAVSKRSFPIGVVAGAGVAEARLAVLPELWIGNTQLVTVPVLVVDLPNLDQNMIQVILAPHRDLDGLALEIDFKDHLLRIHEEAPKTASADLVVPYLQAGFDLVVPAKVGDGEDALFSFDTGMEQAFAISEEYAGRLKKGGKAESPKAGAVLYGAGQSKHVERTDALPVKLAGRTLSSGGEGIFTKIPAGRVFHISGLLGNALWKDRVVVVDTKRHQIAVRAPEPTGPVILKANAKAP